MRKVDDVISINEADKTTLEEINNTDGVKKDSLLDTWIDYMQPWDRSKKNTKFENCNGSSDAAWILDIESMCHTVNAREMLFFEDGEDDGDEEVASGYVLLGKLKLKCLYLSGETHMNIISAIKLIDDGFEIKITKKEATITKNGEIFLKAPMVGNFWIANSVHEKNGWLEGRCPYELKDMLTFKEKYGDEFTMEEITEAFKEFTQDCELDGPRI